MSGKNTALKIARCGIMAGMLIAVKEAFAALPNCEGVTLLLIVFTLKFDREAHWAALIFNMCELVFWGFGTWWVSYMYAWQILVLLTLAFKKIIKDDALLWAVFSAVFGLSFGALFAVLYIPISSPSYALSYWLAGLSWDLIHGVCNFIITLVLFKPLSAAIDRINRAKPTA